VPKGYYRTVEDNPKEIEENTPDEGPIKIPSTHEMASPNSWVHHTQNILQACRLTHVEPEPINDEDPEVILKRIEAMDPYEPRLKPISQDKKVRGGLPAWTVKLHGDQSTFMNANPALGTQNYGVVVVKSL
jgi:hypothetical protein